MKKHLILTILFAMIATVVMAQSNKATGTIVDATGEPLTGAAVRVKSNPSNGAVADINGNFNLNNVKPGTVLHVSYIGFKGQDVKWNGKNLHVVLQDDSKVMDETVIVGFASQKKINATGAVKTIGDEMMKDRPTVNAVQSLQGAVAGLNITNDLGGEPGSTMNIYIRGVGNLGVGSNSSPLILIDGMEGDLNTLNPNDIENVSVLKDAAAASIYGSRAPFGVILVTTKSGKAGKNKKPTINYSGNVRVNQAVSVPNPVDGVTFAYMMNDAYLNSGGNAPFSSTQIDKIKAYMNGTSTANTDSYLKSQNLDTWYKNQACFGNTNWYDEYVKSATVSTEHNLAISGGVDKFTYRISGNYLFQNGLFKYTDESYQRFNVAAKFSYRPIKNLTIGYSVRYAYDNHDKPSAMSDDGLFYHNLGRRASVVPVINSVSGEYSEDSMIPAMLYGGRIKNRTKKLYNQASIVYEPIKNWKIHAEVNSRLEWNPNSRTFRPLTMTMPSGKIGYMLVNEGVSPQHIANTNGTFSVYPDYNETYDESGLATVNYFNNNVYTDYTLNIKNQHHFVFLVGEQTEYYKYNYDNAAVYSVPATATAAEVNGTMQKNYQEDWASMGFFGRINYDWKYRYLLEVDFRADGASRFPTNQRWGYFPSASAGWNIAEEPFMEKAKHSWLDMLKLRGSYGTLGNQNTTSCYPYYQQMAVVDGTAVLGGQQVSKLPVYSSFSETLTWETIENAGVGVDFALFGSRLSGSFDWYQRNTKDMVGPAQQLSALYGTSAPKTNNATLRTRGWEFELKWRDHIKKFNYSIGMSLSDYNSVITKYYSSTGQCTSASNGTYWYEGKELGEIWGYHVEGIAKNDDEMNAHLAVADQSALGSNWGGGDLMYADLNGDGKVDGGSYTLSDHGDLIRIGNTTPHYAYSITLEGSWKWLDFRIYFQGIGKRDYAFYNSAPYWGIAQEWQRSLYTDHLDYFRYAGSELGANFDNPFYARLRIDGNNTKVSDRYVEDASYCRLKNVQIGFTIPFGQKTSKYIKNCRLYVSGENLFTITNLRIFDPEALSGNWGAGKSYPCYRTFSIGADVTF